MDGRGFEHWLYAGIIALVAMAVAVCLRLPLACPDAQPHNTPRNTSAKMTPYSARRME